MKRSEFVKLAINDPKAAAAILKAQAKKLEKCRKVTETAKSISNILFITDRTVFNDCKK